MHHWESEFHLGHNIRMFIVHLHVTLTHIQVPCKHLSVNSTTNQTELKGTNQPRWWWWCLVAQRLFAKIIKIPQVISWRYENMCLWLLQSMKCDKCLRAHGVQFEQIVKNILKRNLANSSINLRRIEKKTL